MSREEAEFLSDYQLLLNSLLKYHPSWCHLSTEGVLVDIYSQVLFNVWLVKKKRQGKKKNCGVAPPAGQNKWLRWTGGLTETTGTPFLRATSTGLVETISWSSFALSFSFLSSTAGASRSVEDCRKEGNMTDALISSGLLKGHFVITVLQELHFSLGNECRELF